MKKARRALTIILIFLLCAGFLGGCGENSSAETTVPATTGSPAVTVRKTLSLPYAKAEPLNPFTAKSAMNRQLSALIYDSLFTFDAAYKLQPVIAESYEAEGLSVKVRLKAGLTFSDGSALDADDVVYSFSRAKTSPAFAGHLVNIGSAARLSDLEVVFYLKSADPYAVNCLDFSVIKTRDNSDLPAGSGRYTVTESKGAQSLQANTARLGGFSPKINRISLYDVNDSASLNYSLQIGNISFVFNDLSEGSYKRINASTCEVGLNNLVYLSFNNASANLKNAAVRSAAALLIDRNSLAQTAFQGHARVTYSPFNPAWTAQYDFTVKSDKKAAVSLLKNAGFNKIYDTGVRYAGWGNALVFSLIVNKGNAFKTEAAKLIAGQLMQAGIKVNVKELALADYTAAVKAGRYDMYLGEIKLTPNMSLAPLLAKGGSVSFGINPASGAAAAYRQFITGKLDLKSFVDAFNADLPFVPLCYRNGIAAYSRALTVPLQCNAEDVYCDIDGWTF